MGMLTFAFSTQLVKAELRNFNPHRIDDEYHADWPAGRRRDIKISDNQKSKIISSRKLSSTIL